MTNLCDECETVSHCLKNGCIPKQPVQKIAPEHLLALLQTANDGLLKVIKAFEIPKPVQEPNYKELYEQACERLDEMDKALAKYEQKEPRACFLCGISDPAVTDICRHEICGVRG